MGSVLHALSGLSSRWAYLPIAVLACAASGPARERARPAALAVSSGQLASQVELEAGSAQAGADCVTSRKSLHG